MNTIEYISTKSELSAQNVQRTVDLLNDGCTVPFIARYRKERTGGMDEVEIASVRDLLKEFEGIQQKQQTILKAIISQGLLTDELENLIQNTYENSQLEDLYLPFKQKKQTRAEKARKSGLESLAKMIMAQNSSNVNSLVTKFIKGEIKDVKQAVEGAKDIMAEWFSENLKLRGNLRRLFERNAVLTTKLVKGKEQEATKYKDYFEHSEPIYKCPSHRFLAITRAHREGFLTIKARPEEKDALIQFERFFVKGNDECSEIVKEACKESYKRLIRPSIEKELIAKTKNKADAKAIAVFSKNLRQLLLSPPIGAKRVLAIDPGFRTGCKVVCLDEYGSLLANTTIFPHPPKKETSKSKAKIAQLVEAYKIEAIAIGDGTAGRETEAIIKHIHFKKEVEVYVVNEDGASIYSASAIARKEFPEYDVTVRGAISIGRRLMDPLAELVKIDPKSIGVGQYQHEVNQQLLKDSLDDVIASCVNSVGVDVNTASPYLLSYVSGLGPVLAENIVKFRTENGGINEREELKKVPRLGAKAFEQAAGFIRISNGKNQLDNSGVHPEQYKQVEIFADNLEVKVADLIENDQLVSKLSKKDFPEIDGYTFDDLIKELKKPGRDPRKKAKILEFDHRINSIDDLSPGMELTGIVTNVTVFGAFVNIGIKENGLIHKSNLADVYVEDPTQFIGLNEHVQVKVLEIDKERKRIGLKRLS